MEVENLTSIREFLLLGLSAHHKIQMILFSTFLLIYSLTLLGNLAVITLVQLNPNLHTPMYFFLSHFSFLEICYTTSTMPQMLAHLLSGNGTISFIRCAIQGYISTTFGGTECFLLAVMAYDRYLAICHPLTYAITMDKRHRWMLTTVCWAICFLTSAINIAVTFQHTFCGSNHINHFFCELPLVVKLACGDTNITEIILFWTSVLVIVSPLIVVLTSYARILIMVFQMRSTASWHKAFSTCASHLAVVTLFYGTLISMYLKQKSESSSNLNKQIAVFYTVVTPLINPIIYTLRNKDIHKAVAKILKRRP
ncbi:PREDICTED: olfactory receptor 1020-like [Thamnophis sirtalis]|uniref:Olfactory receptor n=1 Tax=Thamnophis sirtalis TaxID=35019 RepID=A0A6I9YE71_9SAUR|nr:PREDICTED: olfactory receptor 1020-like [Thamnophis sirtalis]